MRTTRRTFARWLGTGLLTGMGGVRCGLSGTGGRPVTFQMGLRTALAPGEAQVGRFTTDTGWQVELTVARMLLGPIYLFENPSPLQGSRPGRLWRGMGELLLPTAHAHETFFSGGRVLGEWDREVVFDLLAGEGAPLVLGRSPGIAGTVRSFSLLLQPASAGGPGAAAALEGHSVVLEGMASREGHTVAFRAGLDFPPPLEMQRVEFVPSEVALDDEGVFFVEPKPHAWFSGTHFDRLEAPEGGGPVLAAPESQVYRALFINLRRHTAFTSAWVPEVKEGMGMAAHKER
ncbi:hypothetical protein [Stigmatella aurantiaca]|uniref:Conserved uncharacterized protein n=1 Tax=Stigmatella aurantiaca (strain DW4/3-1) TaxID=378806 RepID=Q08UY6_STIAD|nr:hypothetical protein [Stigmatella aurantiaca]ADO68814.1 conserved uncharacterized protein [Stigmatella aurantiaca DW4/3-1]EAU64293.1 hypothetical protein STIAU_0712 [Stigmatella aurantiaca DW4/3-1]